jgi:hypothetical protein
MKPSEQLKAWAVDRAIELLKIWPEKVKLEIAEKMTVDLAVTSIADTLAGYCYTQEAVEAFDKEHADLQKASAEDEVAGAVQ